jgi:hypothetical protein
MGHSGGLLSRDIGMLDRMVLAISAVLFVCAPATAATQDCPTLDGEQIEKLLKDAPSCDKAMETFTACAYGASGDTGLGQIVTARCEADFAAKLSPAERKAYDQKLKRCARKYARESGTMYRSFAAFCRAGVAQAYSRKFLKAKARK